MNTDVVEKIANAVLYEGYMLYPYRPSAVKNQQRFNFGVLHPREYCELQAGSDNWQMQTECLLLGNSATPLEVKVRFLQLFAQQDLQQGVERAVCTGAAGLPSLEVRPLRQRFDFEGVEGELELRSKRLTDGCFKVTLVVRNLTSLANAAEMNRDQILLRSLVSVHSILQARGGKFVSSIDPPEQYQAAVSECRNIGAWPVLVGDEGRRDTLLSAPIILYDYPQIAPESPGDLFDGTEIDEILALRILTLTDAEKEEVRNGDSRARRILERTEMLPPEHFQKLHGALRGLRASPETPQ
jgi:hydrogenase maturation protease